MLNPIINIALVHNLISQQFPQWKNLPIQAVAVSGWDNRSFHLGNDMLIRLPSAEKYASQVEKEQQWLPLLAPSLPLSIPSPIAMGMPNNEYPWKWSIYQWLEGESSASVKIENINNFAEKLAQFLKALQNIDTTKGPLPSADNFYRGGDLINYDSETRHAIKLLANKIDNKTALKIWETGLKSSNSKDVWVHGDVSLGNLLINNKNLSAVIDFGQLAVGDPACDLAIAWTLFKNKSREIFQSILSLDRDTWARGRAWALWKATIVAAGINHSDNAEAKQCWRIIAEILDG